MLLENLQDLRVDNHYAGMGNCVSACIGIQNALNTLGFETQIRHVACDIERSCRAAMCSFDSKHGVEHVFGDMKLRVPRQAAEIIEPPPKEYTRIQKVAYYQTMCSDLVGWFQTNFLKEVRMGECHMHGDLCPYYLDEGEVTAETMTFWSGGGTCTAWSQFGCGRQDSDETMIPLIVIIAQMLCYKKNDLK